jgi:hypothetical protein
MALVHDYAVCLDSRAKLRNYEGNPQRSTNPEWLERFNEHPSGAHIGGDVAIELIHSPVGKYDIDGLAVLSSGILVDFKRRRRGNHFHDITPRRLE